VSNQAVLIPIIDDDRAAELEADFLQIAEVHVRFDPMVLPQIPLPRSEAGPYATDHQLRITRMTSSTRCCR
jgi:hypothetical protein